MFKSEKIDKISGYILIGIFIITIFLALFTFTNFYKTIAGPLTRDDIPAKSDVIIVLGGGVVTDLRILPWGAQERVRRGVELYNGGMSENIILAGGQVKGQSYTESEFMKDYAVFLGVDSDVMIEENKSTSTYENAVNSKKIMDEQGWKNALIVTSDFHTMRACRVFEKVGVSTTCVASYKSSCI